MGRLSQINFKFSCEDGEAPNIHIITSFGSFTGWQNIVNYFLNLEPLAAWSKHFLQFLAYLTMIYCSKQQWVNSSIEIANMLIKLDPSRLEDFDESICTPLYYTKTYNMLVHSLQQWADLNAFCGDQRCFKRVPYRLVTKYSLSVEQFHDIVQKLYDKNHWSVELPDINIIHESVTRYDPLNQTIFLFKEVGLNFNDENIGAPNTILAAAIISMKSTKTLELIT